MSDPRLTTFGVVVNQLSGKQRDKLVVFSKVKSSYDKQKQIAVYQPLKVDGKSYFIVPRNWAFAEYPEVSLLIPPTPKFKNKIHLETKPRKLQEDALTKIINSFREKHCAFIVAGCAFGKSLLSLLLVEKYQKKTLIVVDNKTLMRQWKSEEIEKHFKGSVNVYFWTSSHKNTCNFSDAHIVIATVQTLIKDRYERTDFDTFNLVIFDEVHVFAPEKFSRVFLKISPRYIMGITAEEERSDGLEKVYEHFLGKPTFTYHNKEENGNFVDVIPHFLSGYVNKIEEKEYMDAKFELAQCAPRNKFIIDKITEIFPLTPTSSPRSGILILSCYREHLVLLYYLLLKRDIRYASKSGIIYGGLGEEQTKKLSKKEIIFGIDKICAKSFNAPHLDTLLITLPFKTLIRQISGRVVRKKHKNKVQIIDLIDKDYIPFKLHWIYRKKFYGTRPKFTIKERKKDKFDEEE
jgi:superfamily II DNA or RNA helicase